MCAFRPKTGFQLWLEENRKSITVDHPDLEETDVIKEAMGRFRTLSAEERLVRDTEREGGKKGGLIRCCFIICILVKSGSVP